MKTDLQPPPVRVGLISLGCAKNMVDAEIMLGTLMRDGFKITNDAELADVLIVNTCSFIDAAQEESVDTILQSDELRAVHRPGQGLVVSGCLPQRFRNDLPKLMPEVDAFIGIDQVTQISAVVRQALARRAERVQDSKFKVQSPKLSASSPNWMPASQPRARSFAARRSLARPGQSSRPSPRHRSSMFTCAPPTSRTTTLHAFASPRAISPT